MKIASFYKNNLLSKNIISQYFSLIENLFFFFLYKIVFFFIKYTLPKNLDIYQASGYIYFLRRLKGQIFDYKYTYIWYIIIILTRQIHRHSSLEIMAVIIYFLHNIFYRIYIKYIYKFHISIV